MTENPFHTRLKIKAGQRLLVLNASAEYLKQLQPLPENCTLENEISNGIYDLVQLFAKTKAELNNLVKAVLTHLDNDAIFWICFPKKSSGFQSDLTMYTGWEVLEQSNYNGISMVSLNDNWSACRFKPRGTSKKTDLCNDSIQKQDKYSTYIDVETKTIKQLPEDLAAELVKNSTAEQFFHSLSYTNRKEYLMWILTAKQDNTRTDRVQKTLAKLAAQKKNPTEK